MNVEARAIDITASASDAADCWALRYCSNVSDSVKAIRSDIAPAVTA